MDDYYFFAAMYERCCFVTEKFPLARQHRLIYEDNIFQNYLSYQYKKNLTLKNYASNLIYLITISFTLYITIIYVLSLN